jgi:T4 RnlA family RNA ligase
MNYIFPENLNIDEVRAAIANTNQRVGKTPFVERNTGHGYIVFDYVVSIPGMYLDIDSDGPESREAKIIRECRGLIFDEQTGTVIARGFHKFHNLNGAPKYMSGVVDMTQPYIVLEKLDGSMLRPVRPRHLRNPGDPIRWGTMMGWTLIAKQVDTYVDSVNDTLHYHDLVFWCEEQDVTPIFEWCSRKQTIIIDYPTDKLVLTAVRSNVTGQYMKYDELVELGKKYNVPVVNDFKREIKSLKDFGAYVRDIKNMEGFVIRFENGHMLKMKADEYCAIHHSKEIIAQEKDIIDLIVNKKIDDIIPVLDDIDRQAVEDFMSLFYTNIQVFADGIQEKVESLRGDYENGNDFFNNYVKVNVQNNEESLYMKAWNKYDVVDSMIRHMKLHTGSRERAAGIRKFWGGIVWEDFRRSYFQDGEVPEFPVD